MLIPACSAGKCRLGAERRTIKERSTRCRREANEKNQEHARAVHGLLAHPPLRKLPAGTKTFSNECHSAGI
jgi:hypothetical protein